MYTKRILYVNTKLLMLVYDTLPPTTAITDYAIRLEGLLVHGQIFADAQMAVGL